MAFIPVDDLEENLHAALMILVRKFNKTGDKRFQRELQDVNKAICNYHNTHECGGGIDHDWQPIEDCSYCCAPDGDCQNYHTIWCPTCLGCKED